MKPKSSNFTNREDYNKIYNSILKWLAWQRAYVNEHLLISKYSKNNL